MSCCISSTAQSPAADDDVLARVSAALGRHVPLVTVVNKIDLAGLAPLADRERVQLSALSGAGIEGLRRVLLDIAGWDAAGEGGVYLARARHLHALQLRANTSSPRSCTHSTAIASSSCLPRSCVSQDEHWARSPAKSALTIFSARSSAASASASDARARAQSADVPHGRAACRANRRAAFTLRLEINPTVDAPRCVGHLPALGANPTRAAGYNDHDVRRRHHLNVEETFMNAFRISLLAAAVSLAACGGGGNDAVDAQGNKQAFEKAPNIAPPWLGAVTAKSYDGVTDDLLTAGLGKTGLAGTTAPLPTDTDGSGPAAQVRDLHQLPRHRGHQRWRRLRHALRPQRHGDGHRHHRRRQDRRQRIPRVRRPGRAARERDADGAGADDLRSGQSMHRHRHLERLARRVRRDRHLGRMGPQARLRRRLRRQGHRQRHARPARTTRRTS